MCYCEGTWCELLTVDPSTCRPVNLLTSRPVGLGFSTIKPLHPFLIKIRGTMFCVDVVFRSQPDIQHISKVVILNMHWDFIPT